MKTGSERSQTLLPPYCRGFHFSRNKVKVMSIGRLCFPLSGTKSTAFNSLYQAMFASGELRERLSSPQ